MFQQDVIDAIFSKDRPAKVFQYNRKRANEERTHNHTGQLGDTTEIDVEKEFNKEEMIQSHIIMKNMVRYPEFRALLAKHFYVLSDGYLNNHIIDEIHVMD